MTQQSRRLSVTSPESLPEGVRLRHFDELDDCAQTLVAAGDGPVPDGHGDLAVGDVVVYTRYVHVGAAE